MDNDLSREEEQRGTGRLMMWGAIAAFVVVVVSAVWIFVPTPASRTDVSTGQRSEQTQGVSKVARDTPPPAAASPNASSPETVGRNQDITASSTSAVALGPQQVEAIRNHAGEMARDDNTSRNITLSVGAAVPRSIELHDLPSDLGQALANYTDHQYLVSDNRFVLVEKSTRRIVAIVPIG